MFVHARSQKKSSTDQSRANTPSDCSGRPEPGLTSFLESDYVGLFFIDTISLRTFLSAFRWITKFCWITGRSRWLAEVPCNSSAEHSFFSRAKKTLQGTWCPPLPKQSVKFFLENFFWLHWRWRESKTTLFGVKLFFFINSDEEKIFASKYFFLHHCRWEKIFTLYIPTKRNGTGGITRVDGVAVRAKGGVKLEWLKEFPPITILSVAKFFRTLQDCEWLFRKFVGIPRTFEKPLKTVPKPSKTFKRLFWKVQKPLKNSGN